MNRYIKVSNLYNKVIEAENYYSKLDNFESQTKYKFLLNVITSMIDSTPSEDVTPIVHAEWEWYEEWLPSTTEHPAECQVAEWRCSNCKTLLSDEVGDYWDNIENPPKLNYCPHCGAKMDKIEEDEYAYAESLYEQEMQKQFLEMSDPNTGAL